MNGATLTALEAVIDEDRAIARVLEHRDTIVGVVVADALARALATEAAQ